MQLIPRCYYDKTLLKLIDNFIRDGHNLYSNLDEIDQELITAQCIDILGNDAADCIVECANITWTLNHFTKFLRTSKSEHSYDLAQTMSKNAREYFARDMDELFKERLDEYHEDNMIDAGFKKNKDPINGEITWRKSA
jgi:hypothetical protein